MIEIIELLRQPPCLPQVISQQTVNAQAHVGQSPGGVDPGTHLKGQIHRGDARRRAPGDFQQGADSRHATPGADALQALLHQNAVGMVQRHHVGYCPQRRQIEKLRQIGFSDALRSEPAGFPQPGAQRHQHMENHPDPGQMLAGKVIAWLVRIHQRIRRRQGRAGQMMIGNQHLHAERPGGQDSVVTGNAVIHRDQQIRALLGSDGDDLRGQAIAMHKAVGHHITHLRCAQGAQGPHRQGATGRPVGVKIGDDHDPLPLPESGIQQVHRLRDVPERRRRSQPAQRPIKFRRSADATGRINPLQQRRHRQRGGQGG